MIDGNRHGAAIACFHRLSARDHGFHQHPRALGGLLLEAHLCVQCGKVNVGCAAPPL